MSHAHDKYVITTLDNRTEVECEQLKNKFAEFTGCNPEDVLVLCGVSEVFGPFTVHVARSPHKDATKDAPKETAKDDDKDAKKK